MPNRRREFLKLAGLTSIGVAGGGMLEGLASTNHMNNNANTDTINGGGTASDSETTAQEISIIGLYGAWASSLNGNKLPAFSFRKNEWKNVDAWRKAARQRVFERLAIPDIGGTPKVKINKQYSYDGLQVEEVTWQLPYGRPTEAIVLKPANAKG